MSWLPERLVIEEEDLRLSIRGAWKRLACVILLLPKHRNLIAHAYTFVSNLRPEKNQNFRLQLSL
jgi:hypothetical protein